MPVLSRTQQNDVYEIATNVGLDPLDFNLTSTQLQYRGLTETFTHRPTNSHFSFSILFIEQVCRRPFRRIAGLDLPESLACRPAARAPTLARMGPPYAEERYRGHDVRVRAEGAAPGLARAGPT